MNARLWAIVGAAIVTGIAAAVWKAPAIRQTVSTMTGNSAWDNLHPDLKARALAVIDAAAAQGMTVGVQAGYRTADEERAMMVKGASFVADPLDSYHCWGLAADFVFIDSLGRWTWLPDPNNPDNKGYLDPRWNKLGAIIEANGLGWGGRWKKRDMPHGQLQIASPAALKTAYADPLDYITANTEATA